jgi:branched-chain amino acid transport system substrate-binding protein
VKFVKAFQKAYGRLPSLYASQGYDTANLLLSAMGQADIGNADAFRAALKKANFESTRGAFKFDNNQHPIQDIYVREVIKEGDVYTNKIVSKAISQHVGVYASQCAMK